MTGVVRMVGPSPFMRFWKSLNDDRFSAGLPEVPYGEARTLYESSQPTPKGALTYVENGEGLRAVKSHPVNGLVSYHGEYREITADGR